VEAKLEAKRSTADFGARGWAFRVNFSWLDFSHLEVKGIDTLPTPLHNKC
jgi:hypothetical protein